MAAPASSRKLVVLGIPYSVDTQGLREYMESYGEIEDIIVLKDRHTGRSRGFGYVTFVTQADSERVASMKHNLGGRDLDVKHATPKEDMGKPQAPAPPQPSSTRIFVAKVPPSVSEDAFRTFFEQFGTVTDSYMPKNPGAAAHRGIGFITFDSAESVDAVLSEPRLLEGVEVAIDRATPKEDKGRAPRTASFGPIRSYAGAYAPSYGASAPYGLDRGRDAGLGVLGSRGEGAGRAPLGALAYAPPSLPAGAALGGYYESLYSAVPAPVPGAAAGFVGYPGSYGVPGTQAASAGGGKVVHPTKVFVAKLASETTADDLRDYFSRYGPVSDVYLPKDAAKQGHRGFAFVTFEEEEVAAFVAKRQHTILGRQIAIERATPPEGQGAKGRAGESQAYAAAGVSGAGGPAAGMGLDHSQLLHLQSQQLLQAQLGSALPQYGASGEYGAPAASDRTGGKEARYRPY